jgi:hypothetical protein
MLHQITIMQFEVSLLEPDILTPGPPLASFHRGQFRGYLQSALDHFVTIPLDRSKGCWSKIRGVGVFAEFGTVETVRDYT